MAQITLYLDEELRAKLRAAARATNLSQSRWVANLITEKLHHELAGSGHRPGRGVDRFAGGGGAARGIRTGRYAGANPMMYTLDTNTLIYFFKGMGRVEERLLAHSPQEIGIPAVVLYELEVGLAKSTSPEKRRQ